MPELKTTSQGTPDQEGIVRPVSIIGAAVGALGILAVFNAGLYENTAWDFIFRESCYLLIGVVFLFLIPALRGRLLLFLLGAGILAAWAGLCLVLFYGIRINHVRGWFAWKGLFIQPAEIAQPFFVLGFAALVAFLSYKAYPVWKEVVLLTIFWLLWTVPLALQPLVGYIGFYIIPACAVWLILRQSFKTMLVAVALVCAVNFLVFEGVRQDQNGEESAPTDQVEVSETNQFHRSLTRGGLFGEAWGEQSARGGNLESGYTPSIIGAFAESTGFAGVFILIMLFSAWLLYAFSKAAETTSVFRAVVLVALPVLLALEGCVFLSSKLGLLPLPTVNFLFPSHGASPIITVFLIIAVVEKAVMLHTNETVQA